MALLASDADKVYAEEVMDCMDVIMAQEPKWGVRCCLWLSLLHASCRQAHDPSVVQITFFAYDWFSATRTPMAREVLYDTFIPVRRSCLKNAVVLACGSPSM